MSGKGGDGLKRQGSVTVEAALVMPLVLGAIFFVITFGMWLRDAGVAEALTLESVQRTRRESADSASAWLNQELEWLFWADPEGADVEKQGKTFRATAGGGQSIFGIKQNGTFQCYAKRKEIDPVRLLRTGRLLAESR